MIQENISCGCSSQDKVSVACTHCGKNGTNVDAITIKSQLKKEKKIEMRLGMDEFNFCSNPTCDTVYYSNDGSESFSQADIKSKVTIKNDDPKTPLCYCRKILKGDVIEMINNNEPDIAQKIKAKLSKGKSFCEKSNPKGSCCTQEIDAFLATYGIDFNENKKAKFSLEPQQNLASCCDTSSGCC